MYQQKLENAQMHFDIQNTALSAPEQSGMFSVMVVDDDPVIRDLVSIILDQKGYDVTTAENAFEALNAMEKGAFRFVVTDFQMPGMDGLMLSSKIKKQYPKMPVVLLTGSDMEAADKAEGMTFIDFLIPKPFRIDSFMQTIRQI